MQHIDFQMENLTSSIFYGMHIAHLHLQLVDRKTDLMGNDHRGVYRREVKDQTGETVFVSTNACK